MSTLGTEADIRRAIERARHALDVQKRAEALGFAVSGDETAGRVELRTLNGDLIVWRGDLEGIVVILAGIEKAQADAPLDRH